MPIAGLAADVYEAEAPTSTPPLVVVHGAMDRAAGFRRTIRHLPGRDAVAYDRRGYAGSHEVAPTDRIGDHVDDLAAVCRATAERFGRLPLVVGHSMGGLLALHLLARPESAELVVGAVDWEGPLPWFEWYGGPAVTLEGVAPETAAERFLRTMIGDRLFDHMPSAMRAQRLAEGAALQADLAACRHADAEVDLAAIRLPVLAGYGTASVDRHRRSAATAAALVEGAELVVVEDADHGIHLAKPAEFARVIGSWPSGERG